MKHFSAITSNPVRWVIPFLALLLVLAVACGSAAAPDAAPATQPEPVETLAAETVPTAIPQAAPDDAMDGEINPGKLTILVGGWGGRFMPLFNSGCHAYSINHGAFLIRSDENRQYVPGIATDWQVSDDGFTWTFTIREDGKFHDGTAVSAEDVAFTWNQTWGPGALEVATGTTAINNSKNTEKIDLPAPTR